MRINSVLYSPLYFALLLPLFLGFLNFKKAPASDSHKAVLIPSKFINGERFYIKMPSVNGDTLLGFGDTGGGLAFVMPRTIDKLKLQNKVKTGTLKLVLHMKYIPFDDIIAPGITPAPVPLPVITLKRHFKEVMEPYFFALPMNEDLKFFIQYLPCDIFLGQNYFMGKSWTFDYIHQQIWINTPLSPSDAGVQKIGIRKNSKGEVQFGHPSTTMEVDSEQIDVLFDTGATIIPSDSGKIALNTIDKTIGGSFIATSVFDKWHKAHPDWKIYNRTDRKADVIEVPKLKLGGYEVGPVLFAERPDANWSQGMIGSMDKVLKGAIGGSALKYLKVTIDYNSELIRFEQ